MTRCTRWLCLVGYALVASGLPLPVGTAPAGSAGGRGDRIAAGRLAGKDRSRAFPCMDKPCGCATAEQCFTSCCCHTPAESLAWARAHDVDAAVLASLERRVAASLPESDGCCSRAKPTSCCAAEAAPAPQANADAACCASASPAAPPSADAAAADTGDAAAPETRTFRGVVLRAMLACGGIAAEWFACTGGLPPPPVTLPVTVAAVACVPEFDTGAVVVPASPDTPPPRAA